MAKETSVFHTTVRRIWAAFGLQPHRAKEFLDFLKEIDANVPADFAIHIVMDNYATHKTKEVKAWLARSNAGLQNSPESN